MQDMAPELKLTTNRIGETQRPATSSKNHVDVWDKEGNHHRVSPLNAADLVNHLGYTRNAPIVRGAAKEEQDEVAEKAAKVEAEKDSLNKVKQAQRHASEDTKGDVANLKAKAEGVKKGPPVKLEDMSIEALRNFGAQKFNLQIGETWSRQEIIDAIQTELDGE